MISLNVKLQNYMQIKMDNSKNICLWMIFFGKISQQMTFG